MYGGIEDRSDCDSFPAALKDGCYWRFDWFLKSENPTVTYTQVACPAALTAKSGCIRAKDGIDETPTGPASVATWSANGAGATSSVNSSSPANIPLNVVAAAPPSSQGTTMVPQYGQCGGSTYTGPTQCAAGT